MFTTSGSKILGFESQSLWQELSSLGNHSINGGLLKFIPLKRNILEYHSLTEGKRINTKMDIIRNKYSK